jgi:hypothetical protein
LDNYFNYFTEIEEHFQRRRGTGLLLSTLDWALIEIWKDAGVPLAAVLRGIDAAFDKYEQRPSRTQKVNSLAYCSQAVLTAAEEMKEAAVGASGSAPVPGPAPTGFDRASIIAFLTKTAEVLEKAELPGIEGSLAQLQVAETASALRSVALDLSNASSFRLEDLERRLTVMEEKLFAALLASTPDDELVQVRAEADRELAPYRRKMPAAQIDQLQRQFVHKRLLDRFSLPRLSLFYL